MSLAWDVRIASKTERIPEHWQVRRIGDLVTLINGYPFPSDSFGPTGDLPLVRIRDLAESSFETYVTGHVPQFALLRDGDVVIGMDGDFNLVTWDRGEAALNQRLCLLRPRSEVDMRFLAYALPTSLRIINDLTFATTVKHLSSGDVLSERIMLPPLAEQRRIADFLDIETAHLDRLLDARQRHIRLVEQRWEATIHQELIQSGASEVELRRLGVRVTTGPFGTAFNASEYQEGGVPMVNPLHIRGGEIFPDSHHAVALETAARLARHRLRAGDLVVGRKGDLGRAALVRESQDGWVCGSDCIAVHPGPQLRSHFLDYVLRSQYIRSQLLAKSLATTMPSLNEGNLLSLRITHLTLEEQDAVAARLDQAHDWLVRVGGAMRQQLALLRERRQALITAAVTGQFDVSTASGRNVTEGVTA